MEIEWTEQMRVHISDIDEEHRKIVIKLKALQQAVQSGQQRCDVINCFNQLIELAKKHLEHEEQMLAEAGYPKLEEHQRHHDNIISNCLRLQARFMSGLQIPFTMNEVESTCELLVTHLIEEDRAFGEYLLERGYRKAS